MQDLETAESITLVFRPVADPYGPGARTVAIRIRRLLKQALRDGGLRCTEAYIGRPKKRGKNRVEEVAT